MQVRFVARAYPLYSGSRFVFCFYAGRILKTKSYVTFAKEDGSVTVQHII